MKTYDDETMTPAMVAELFHVHPHTITTWANAGKLPYFKTAGGHKRFNRSDVEKFKQQQTVKP